MEMYFVIFTSLVGFIFRLPVLRWIDLSID
jgi:hypothetical protein